MARIRTVKPDFWSDAKIIECSVNARLLFIGTWNFADDAGNFDRSAKQIKARVFPADNLDCEPLLLELIEHGLLTEYSVNGHFYLHIHGFSKHQKINKPGPPQFPLPEHSVNGAEHSRNVHQRKGREGKGKEEKGAADAAPSEWLPPEWGEFEQHRKEKRASLTPTARKACIAKLERWRASGHDVKAILRYTIDNGYTGLFEPKAGAGTTKADLTRWWKSDDGISAKAKELGVHLKGQGWPMFKAQVFVAAGEGPWIDERDGTTFRLVRELRERAK